MKTISNTILTFLFTILLAFTACKGDKTAGTEAKEEEHLAEDIVEMRADQIKLAKIETGNFELRALSGTLKVSGIVTVSPENMASVCMPMGGFVKSTTLTPGSAVRKGQALAIFESQDFIDLQQNYLEARNKLDYAEEEYKRHTELYKEDVYSQKNVQQVTSEYKNLKAQVKALEQKLTMIGIHAAGLQESNISNTVSVTAPISGYIKSVNINVGKSISPSDVLFEIINSDKMILELTLFEKDADKVSIGQNLHFYVNNEIEQHDAVIYQTGKAINADKTFKVYADVSGGCRNVLPGMYVNAIIEASTNKVNAIPAEAVVSFDDKAYIFVFEKDKTENGKAFTEYRMVEVHKGVTDGGFTEIILPEGFNVQATKVVVKGAYNLLSAKKNAGEMSC